jgi:DNA-directed RNA polymerase subunit L
MEPTLVGYANTLRRTMITDVETIAFRSDITENGSTSDITIVKNSTPLSNEMLAHRIGLIPIHVENPLDWKPEEYSFSLKVSNESSDPLDVVAGDIQVLKNRGAEEEPLLVPNVQFFHPDPVTHDTALLTVLKGKLASQEPETVEFTATATLGTGRENAAFMPVTSRCAYGYSRDDDPERKKEIFTLWLTKHKKVSPSELEANPTRKAELEREFETMEVQRCYKIDERGEPYSFDFIVESVGVLPPSYIVARALEILQAKMLRYASIDSGDLPEQLKVLPADARMKGFDFVFQKEDHTLGNLLQTWMEQNLVDTEEITFVGYKVPHPLRDEMLLRVGVDSGKDVDARAAVAKAARECAQMFKNWSGQWASAART